MVSMWETEFALVAMMVGMDIVIVRGSGATNMCVSMGRNLRICDTMSVTALDGI